MGQASRQKVQRSWGRRILTRSQDRNRRSEGEGGRGEGKGVDRGQSREGLEDWVKQTVAYSKLPLSHFPWSPHWSDDPLDLHSGPQSLLPSLEQVSQRASTVLGSPAGK